MVNIKELKDLIKQGDAKQIAEYIKTHNLKLEGNKITCLDSVYVNAQIEYWDKRQLVKKLNLNSTYGALLNTGSRFFDQRLGQSVTLTGRQVVKHMSSETNKIITNEYDYRGKAINYNDTDSVAADSIIITNKRDMTIEELFLAGNEFWKINDKEFSKNNNIQVYHYDNVTNKINFGNYKYVYRHKVSKKKYRIKTADNNEVIVTEDHSVMVLDNNNNLTEKKPNELKKGDKVITIK